MGVQDFSSPLLKNRVDSGTDHFALAGHEKMISQVGCFRWKWLWFSWKGLIECKYQRERIDILLVIKPFEKGIAPAFKLLLVPSRKNKCRGIWQNCQCSRFSPC